MYTTYRARFFCVFVRSGFLDVKLFENSFRNILVGASFDV